jgi:hypothetical protein
MSAETDLYLGCDGLLGGVHRDGDTRVGGEGAAKHNFLQCCLCTLSGPPPPAGRTCLIRAVGRSRPRRHSPARSTVCLGRADVRGKAHADALQTLSVLTASAEVWLALVRFLQTGRYGTGRMFDARCVSRAGCAPPTGGWSTARATAAPRWDLSPAAGGLPSRSLNGAVELACGASAEGHQTMEGPWTRQRKLAQARRQHYVLKRAA